MQQLTQIKQLIVLIWQLNLNGVM